MDRWYHQRLTEIYRFHVAPNQRVLVIGCTEGRLISELKAARFVLACSINFLW